MLETCLKKKKKKKKAKKLFNTVKKFLMNITVILKYSYKLANQECQKKKKKIDKYTVILPIWQTDQTFYKWV